MTTKLLLGPIGDGLRKDIKPFAQPENSFAEMRNAYTFRGRVVRRKGYTLLGRLSIQIPDSIIGASAQNFTANLFAVIGVVDPGANLVPGSLVITVNGATYTLQDTGNPGQIIQTGGVGADFTSGTINYLTSAIALNFTLNPGGNVTASFLYAINQPVMGLRTREIPAINAEQLIAFDMTYSYTYNNTSRVFRRLTSTLDTIWSGTNSQFFFSTNYADSFWATNSKPGLHGINIQGIDNANPATVTTSINHGFTTGQQVVIINVSGYDPLVNTNPPAKGGVYTLTVTSPNTFTIPLNGALYSAYSSGGIALNSQINVTGQDGIRYYTGSTWVNYNPPIDQNTALAGALLIFPYRGYLIFLNTYEGNEAGINRFPQRARATQIGTPYYSTPVPALQTVDPKAARDDLFGRGTAIDAPTNEFIIAAGFIRDVLVVEFERSTWRLRFTANTVTPFVWERVNVELGSESTFSAIIFDKGLMSIGDRGIIISDGNDTVRIDSKIPDQVFQIRNANDGPQRVHGIRTFETKLNYWTIPTNTLSVFPNTLLVYNYDMSTWSLYNDSFTCFGYFQPFNDVTWADLKKPWSSYVGYSWNSGAVESFYESPIAGNQQGFVEIMEQGIENDISLNITALTAASPGIFTALNHNLETFDWITLSGISGITQDDGIDLNGRNFRVITINKDTFRLEEFAPFNCGTAAALSSTFIFELLPPLSPIYPGSVQINVGSIVFKDVNEDGILVGNPATNTGSIDYATGIFVLNFTPALAAPADVIVRVVADQPLFNVGTTGTYTGGGYITTRSNIDIKSKVFNFFPNAQKTKLETIDFYLQLTSKGEFTCDIYGDTNTTIPLNKPLSDNPRSNIVLTKPVKYQIPDGSDRIYRLYCQTTAQTYQLGFRFSDKQMAVNSIQASNIDISAMIIHARPGGRLI